VRDQHTVLARTPTAAHPLAGVAAAVTQAGARGPLVPVFGPAPGDDWVRVSDLVAHGHLARWLDETRHRSAYGHRQAAAVKLTDLLAQALLGFAVQSIFLAAAAPDLDKDQAWLHWSAGRIDGVTLASPAAAVSAGHGSAGYGSASHGSASHGSASHGSAGHPQAHVVPDDDALDRWVAGRVAATLGPLLSGIRASTGTGLVTLWGRVADIVHVQMLRAARDLGHDTQAAWRRAGRLTDAIGEAVPRLRLRPRPFPVCGVDQAGRDWDGTWLVFGTCCFLYKARPDIRQCNVCPLRSDLDRSFDWLQELPPASPVRSAGPA
jgi:hypothetical protein